MKKALLLMALMAGSAAAMADDGIVEYGANITVLPSTRWSSSTLWGSDIWVYNAGTDYGDPYNTTNGSYNQVLGVPADDANGLHWYEPGFDESWKDDDVNWDVIDTLTGEEQKILWHYQNAPYHNGDNWGGLKSYNWTLNNNPGDIYFRRTFTTEQLLSGPVYLACGHDDAPAEYYINGVKVFEVTGWETDDAGNIKNGWNADQVVKLTDEQKSLIKLGGQENLIAVHVHQNWGGSFADCGLYTRVEGGLDMGYTQSWTGKILFNSWGGYNFDGTNNVNPDRAWEKLYEAKEGDVYTVAFNGKSEEAGGERISFKTPIALQEDHQYTFSCKLTADCDYSNVNVKICQNDKEDDDATLYSEDTNIAAGEETTVNLDFDGLDMHNIKILFDMAGAAKDTSVVTISEMSLVDENSEEEIFIGNSYFNDNYASVYAEKEVTDGDGNTTIEPYQKQIADPVMTGRTETLSWTQADFDDSMWEEAAMPIGNKGYMNEVQTYWPGNKNNLDYVGDDSRGENTNYWIRRDFELEKVNERLSYALNVCHDDTYWTYVNGHLLQQNSGWTGGKSPVQVHIPSRYLNVGKNVIATYIQQNWGGRFYDCGINVEEVNYDECADLLKTAIANAKTALEENTLTAKMKADFQAAIAAAEVTLTTEKDAAEVKNTAVELNSTTSSYKSASTTVVYLNETIALCQEETDKCGGYFKTTLDGCVSGIDSCATSSEASTMLSQLRWARMYNAKERHTDKYVGCKPEAGGSAVDETPAPRYYIYNVGERQFLTGGLTWGTHAALDYYATPMSLVNYDVDNNELEDGTYRIETFRANGDVGYDDYLGYSSYIDCTHTDGNNRPWTLIPVEGKENVYNIARSADTSKLLGYNNSSKTDTYYVYNVTCDRTDRADEANQWMFISEDEMNNMYKQATAEAPVDMTTPLISNPNFNQYKNCDDWSISYEQYQKDGNYYGGAGIWKSLPDHYALMMEAWNAGALVQELPVIADVDAGITMPAGWYELSFQGYYRDGSFSNFMKKWEEGLPITQRADLYVTIGEREESVPIVSAGDGLNKVPGLGTEKNGKRIPDSCWEAGEYYFWSGLYWNHLFFYLSEEEAANPDGFTIGIRKSHQPSEEDLTDGEWVTADNFRLSYFGNTEEPADAIKQIQPAQSADSYSIYNMAGQKLQNTRKGVNIINGKKVMINK